MYYVNYATHPLRIGGVKFLPGIHAITSEQVAQASADPLRGNMVGTEKRIGVYDSLKEVQEGLGADRCVSLISVSMQPATADEPMSMLQRIERLKEFNAGFDHGHIKDFLNRLRAIYSGTAPKPGSRFQSSGETMKIEM